MKYPIALFLVIALIIVLKASSGCTLNLRLQKLVLKSEIPSLVHLRLVNVQKCTNFLICT